MFDPLSERKERKKRRKEHQRTARIKKLLHAAREGVNSVKGRIVDPVWNHLARQLAIGRSASKRRNGHVKPQSFIAEFPLSTKAAEEPVFP
jgi:hypothetical protein